MQSIASPNDKTIKKGDPKKLGSPFLLLVFQINVGSVETQ